MNKDDDDQNEGVETSGEDPEGSREDVEGVFVKKCVEWSGGERKNSLEE